MKIHGIARKALLPCMLFVVWGSTPVSSRAGDVISPRAVRGVDIRPDQPYALSISSDDVSGSPWDALLPAGWSQTSGILGDTLRWDDGSVRTTMYYFSGGNGEGVEFEPYYYPCRVFSLIQFFPSGWPDPGGDDLILWIMDDDGPDGAPGTILSADTLMNVISLGEWNEFTVNDTGVVIADGNFYGVYIQMEDGPNCPAMSFDSGYDVSHTWDYSNGIWKPTTTYGDLLLRAFTLRAGGPAHDVGVLSIVTPGTEYDAGSPVTPSAVVKNWGTYTEEFGVGCRIELEGAPVYEDSVHVSSLPLGMTTTVSFSPWNPDAGDVYHVTIETRLASDVTPANDASEVTTHNYTVEREQALIEEATGTWCVYCPYSAEGLDSLREVAGDSVAIVAYHGSDDFSNASGDSRIAYYNISGFPTVIFDGLQRLSGGGTGMYNSYRLLTNIELQKKVPVGILLQGNYNGSTRDGIAYIDLDAIDGIPGEDLRVYTVLTESHIPFSWFDQDSLQFVERGMFPDSSGIPVIMGKGDSDHEVVNFSVDPGWDASHCEIVVFLQDYPTREVYASASSPIMDLTVSIGDEGGRSGLPRSYALSQNYPNPFNPRTTIAYEIPEGTAEPIALKVYDLRGRLVKVLDSGEKAPGVYRLTWDGRNEEGESVASGIYLYQLSVGSWQESGKMVLLK